ncbi:hypothetical protein [Haloferula sp. A504]|uniref:hypothetical protein n=1 Tax=Haloferula sp. A504 TaxID=3373601 RepID=UPI0031CB2219|nr:hypothetical protein [Verrucomicrobiaceae bacterium E54]
MKSSSSILIAILMAGPSASGQSEGYTNFIRQTLLETSPPIHWDVNVESDGERMSMVPVDLAGSRYELWTVKTGAEATSYLLDVAYVSAYAPVATMTIRTEDPYSGPIPRTRADRPFHVDIDVQGLLSGPQDPAASKSVRLLRHVQSYGNTDGSGIDRSQAILHSQAVLDQNGTTTLSYPVTSIPGADRRAVRGEERFSVFTRNDDGSIDQQLVSRYVQIWPVPSAAISGVTPGEVVRVHLPTLTVTVNDLYPKSYTYTQIYKGAPALGTEGDRIAAAQLQIDQATPEDRVWTSDNYGSFITEDGQWTVEVVTESVFGTERLAYVTFEVDRTLEVNSMISTSEGS